MSQYLITCKIDDAFYKEFSEQGTPAETLLEQLQFDIQDQIEEYDLQGLITRMMSSDQHNDLVSFAPQKADAEAEI